jgi:hypothetical protein
MPDTNAINRGALVTAILGRRFPAASQTTNALRWLGTAYSDVWHASDWTFKRVSLSNLSVVAGTRTPTMPTDYGESLLLVDQYGDELERMPQEQFEATFASDFALNVRGAPWAFTVVSGQLILGPIPSTTATFLHSYQRRVSHLQSDQATVQAGFMDADADYPLWSDHHGVLIPRAVAIGLQELNDPTWQEPQQEYERQLSRMEEDHGQKKVAGGYRAGSGHWGEL